MTSDTLVVVHAPYVVRGAWHREIRRSNGWTIKIGRGSDIYRKPEDWLHVGADDLGLRPCLETNVDIARS